jgi:integration host factor subunit alpha
LKQKKALAQKRYIVSWPKSSYLQFILTNHYIENEQKNVTRKDLAVSVTEKLGFSHRKADEIVDTVFEPLKNTLVKGKSIKLVQFGSLNVRDKCPRRGRNPKTGESMVNFEAADDHFPAEQTVA